MAKRIYQMPRRQAQGLLDLAKSLVPLGIYALEKNNIIMLRNDKLSKTQTKEMRRKYVEMGYRVYASGL